MESRAHRRMRKHCHSPEHPDPNFPMQGAFDGPSGAVASTPIQRFLRNGESRRNSLGGSCFRTSTGRRQGMQVIATPSQTVPVPRTVLDRTSRHQTLNPFAITFIEKRVGADNGLDFCIVPISLPHLFSSAPDVDVVH